MDGQIARGFIDRDSTAVNNGSGNYSSDIGVPDRGPDGQRRIGTVRVQGDNKIVRQNHDQNSNMVARVSYPQEFPCYDEQRGSNGRRWFFIWVDGVWGWISEGVSILDR